MSGYGDSIVTELSVSGHGESIVTELCVNGDGHRRVAIA